jgi:hypothetical protein
MAPAAFLRQMAQLVRARRAADAAALYERHGAAVAPRLGERDRGTLAALMEYIDTVIGWTPPADRLQSDGQGEETASRADGAPGSRVKPEWEPSPPGSR